MNTATCYKQRFFHFGYFVIREVWCHMISNPVLRVARRSLSSLSARVLNYSVQSRAKVVTRLVRQSRDISRSGSINIWPGGSLETFHISQPNYWDVYTALMELSVAKSVLRFIQNLALSFRIYEVLVANSLASLIWLNSCDINSAEHH